MQNTTIWQCREPLRCPALRGRISADVVVVGGGFTGLACALWLSRAGLRTVVLEADRLGHGASSCCAGIVSIGNGPRYAALEKLYGAETAQACAQTQQSALRALKELAREGAFEWRDVDFFLCGSQAEQSALDAEAAALQRAGIAAERRLPAHCPLEAGQGLRMGGMGILHPLLYLHFLAREAQRRGARIYEASRVVSVETNAVYTQSASVQAPYLIIATGYPIVNIPGWYFLHLEQREGRILPLKGSAAFSGVYASMDGQYAIRPMAEGALLHCSAACVGNRKNDEFLQAASRTAAAVAGMEALPGACGIEACTFDGLPFIGPYGRKTPNLFVAAGYGGNGILGSMTAAQAISAHILGLPAQGYDIYSGRRALQDVRMPARIGSRYIGAWMRKPAAPRCPHLGCRLVYNAKTRIWECPCHGSRFDDIGHVLNAPAIHEAQLRSRK